MEFEPGTQFHYSNSRYFLLGAVLEQVSDSSYERLLKDRIFTPLGMNDSGYAHSETIIPSVPLDTSVQAMDYRMLDSMTCRFHLLPVRCTRPLAIFCCGTRRSGERLLPANLRDLLFKPNLENYGFGWGIFIPKPDSPGEIVLMHGGAIFGFQSVIERIPTQRDLIVLLDNTDSPKLLEIAMEIRRVLSEQR